LMRPHLPPGTLSTVELAERPHNSTVAVAGMVVARQRPSTANGVVFMLLEDEYEQINLIVPPQVYDRYRAVIRGEPLLLRPAGLGGVRKPKFPVPGGDLAGTVERAGSAVTAFKPGDEVYGFGHGAFAEYIAVRQDGLAPKPGNLTFEQAAAVPLAAVTALQGLSAGGIQPGPNVLIIGASGGVGTFAVQIARLLGAQVTGVCSTRHADVVRRLGAEQVIDYAEQDFTLGAARYDLILQLGGTYSPAAVKKVLSSWGPGRYDAELVQDGKAFRPDGKSAATLLPAAFGLAGVNLHTYNGWGSVTYWNAYARPRKCAGAGPSSTVV